MKYELIAGEWGDLSTYLFRVDDDGTKTEIGSDFGEPEDNSFYRDWSFVPEELNKLAAERDRLRALCIRLRDWVSLPGVQISGVKEWDELADVDHEMEALGIELPAREQDV